MKLNDSKCHTERKNRKKNTTVSQSSEERKVSVSRINDFVLLSEWMKKKVQRRARTTSPSYLSDFQVKAYRVTE